MLFLYFFRTPPFSSDEESEEEEETDEEEEEHPHVQQRGKLPLNQATPVQSRTSKTPTVQARQTAVRQPFSSSPQQARVSVGGVTKTALTKIESDEEDEEEEWSDVSELQEIDPRQLQSHKDQNGNVNKKNFGQGKWISSQLPLVRTVLETTWITWIVLYPPFLSRTHFLVFTVEKCFSISLFAWIMSLFREQNQ